MKEILSGFGSEVFRPLVTFFLPGAISISSWVAAVLWGCDSIRKVAGPNRAETLGILVLLVVFFGLICDDLGSRLESGWLDERTTDGLPKEKHDENWYRYLRLAFSVEPVGHRYMRTLVLHLKFELGTAVAFVLATPGIWWLPLRYSWRAALTMAAVVAVPYLIFEGQSTHVVLRRLRLRMLDGVEAPSGPPASQAAP
jgi:hypothetical protein